MRKNILIQLDNFGNACDYNRVIGINGENLQGKLSFILDTPIKGAGYIEVLHDEVAELIPAETDDYHTYYIDIKNNLLKYSKFYFQLRINENSETNYPVFKSAMLTGYVGDAINASEIIPDPYPDWISKADKELEKMIKQEAERQKNEEIRENQETARQENEETRQNNENSRQEYIENLKDKVNKGDFNGATYLPSVDKEGNISWTNDKGLENPSSQNIRGPQGIQGPQGEAFKIKKTYPSIEAMQADFNNMEVGDYVMITSNIEVEDNAKLYSKTETEWVFITDFSGATGIQGEQGPQGEQGIQGERGIGISRLEVRDGSLYVTLTDNTTQNAGLIITDEAKNYIIDQVTNNAKSDFNVYYDDKVANFDNLTANKIKEYNDNASQKIAEYDEHSTELNNKVVSTRNELERVKNDILETGSASDSFINVQDSAWAELQKLEIEGVCQQETTTGSQLYNINTTSTDSSYVSKTNDDWITVSASNTTSDTMYVNVFDKPIQKLKTSTNYTIVAEIKSVSYKGNDSNFYIFSYVSSQITNGQFSVSYYKRINTLINNSILVTQGTTLADFANSTTGLRTFVSIAPGNSVSITFRLSVLESLDINSSNFVYEKYTGYQPSPSPDYPEEIKTITGNLKITSCGRNLFNINEYKKNITGQGIASTVEGSSIICNGTATTTYATILVPLAKNIKFYPGQYTMSMANSLPYNIAIQTERLNGSRGNDLVLYSGKTSEIINIAEILIVNSMFLAFQTARPNLTNFTISDIQIEQANTASEYEHYVESLIEANLPEGEFIGKFSDTNKDYVSLEYNKEDGQYHAIVNKYIGKYVLNGSENWIENPTYRGIFMLTKPDIIQKYDNKYVQSNNFLGVSNYNFNSNISTIDNSITNYGNTRLFVAFRKYQNNLSGFKSWQSIHNSEVYYALNTPYKIDLGPIDMPLSYNEVTNIFTDSDLLPTINAKYYRNFITTVQNLQVNEKALKQELIDINNRLTALETAKANVVESEEEANDIQVQ